MKRTVAVSGAIWVLLTTAIIGCGGSESFRVPDTDYEEIEEICAELNVEYEEAREYIDEHEIQESREHVGRMVYLSAKLSAFAPSQRHDEFKEQADRLKEQCLELEQAVVGYDDNAAWNRVSEIRQTCHRCHDLY
jgi:hypothetical protein